MALPDFTKVGTLWSTTDTALPSQTPNDLEVMFPRLFDVDSIRSTSAMTLPSKRWLMLTTSDHGFPEGFVLLSTADDIEGPWTQDGIIDSTGVEAASIIYDYDEDHFDIIAHPNDSNLLYGFVNANRHTSTDIANGFTLQGRNYDFGNHNGYAWVTNNGGSTTWEAVTGLMGSEVFHGAHFTSSDGHTWTYNRFLSTSPQHIVGEGQCIRSVHARLQWEGITYCIVVRTSRPRIPVASDPGDVIAIPIDPDTYKPIGGYYTLFSPTPAGNDEIILNYLDPVVDNGTIYIPYVGRESGGAQHIMLAKSSTGSATQVAVTWPINSDGTLKHHTSSTSVVNWDAANDALPASITKVRISGTDNSNQSVGNYYELKTGSGSVQNIYIRSTSTVDPATAETVEWEIEGLQFEPEAIPNAIQMGWINALPTVTGDSAFLFFDDLNATRKFGSLLEYENGSLETETATSAWNYAEAKTAAGFLGEWTRNNPFTHTLRIHDYGRRFSWLVNGEVIFHKTLGITWGNEVFGFLRLIVNTPPHDQHYARFTQVTLNTYAIAAPTSLAASGGFNVIDLTWTDPGGSKLDKINVYRSTTSGSGYTLINGAGGTAIGNQSYQDATAVLGTTYYYVVRAVDEDANESADSNEASAAVGADAGSLEYAIPESRLHYAVPESRLHWKVTT